MHPLFSETIVRTREHELERAGLVVGGQGVYRVTRRGRAALELDAALRATIRRALSP